MNQINSEIENEVIEDASDTLPDMASKIAGLRREQKWTLKEASKATGVAASTLSKIERSELSPTISTLQKIASGFGLDVIQLLSNREDPQKLTGRRSITRAHEGSVYHSKTCVNAVLCHDLKHKRMTPLYTKIGARSVDEYTSWPKSDAEIFLYVIKGTLVVNSRLYEPIELHEGDSMYYDATTEHLWTTAGAEDAEILWLISNN